MRKKEHQLKALLKQVQADKPGAGFTDKLMSHLQETTAKTTVLNTLLATLPKDVPSRDFTATIITKIKTPVTKPLISHIGWWAIAAAIILPIGLLWVSGYHQETLSTSNQLTTKLFSQLFKSLNGEYIVIPFTLIAVVLLLSIDYFFKSRKQII